MKVYFVASVFYVSANNNRSQIRRFQGESRRDVRKKVEKFINESSAVLYVVRVNYTDAYWFNYPVSKKRVFVDLSCDDADEVLPF